MPRKRIVDTDSYSKAFPKALRLLMQEQNITQQELADYIDKKRQTVSCYCDGSSSPDWETLVKIATYFSVSTDWLLGVSSVRSTDATLQAAVEYTGIPEDAIQVFRMCATTKILLSPEHSNPQIKQAVKDGAAKANAELNDSDAEDICTFIGQQYASVFDMIVGFMQNSSIDSAQWIYLRDMAKAHFNFISLQKEYGDTPDCYGNPDKHELEYALFRCQQSYIEYCKQLAKGE